MQITVTGLELERMDSIVEQIEYLLRQVVGMTGETEIQSYLEAVRKKQISMFKFFGVQAGTRNAQYALYLEIDWTKHANLISTNPYITLNSLWGDGDNKKVNPDIRYEAHKFLKNCIGLEIDWCFTYSSSDIIEEMNKKLGTHTISSDEQIIPPEGNYRSNKIFDLDEISIKVNS